MVKKLKLSEFKRVLRSIDEMSDDQLILLISAAEPFISISMWREILALSQLSQKTGWFSNRAFLR